MGSSAGVSAQVKKNWEQLLEEELDKLSPLERVKYIDNLLRDCTPGQPKQTKDEVTLRELQAEKQDLLNTISEIAGTRLKNNNPGITNLSDNNRPGKLSEKFSELYDNQWTDFMELCREVYKPKRKPEAEVEKTCIHFILQILKLTYEWCKKESHDQFEKFMNIVLFTDTSKPTKKTADLIEQDVQQRCKEYFKEQMSTTPAHLDEIKKQVKEHVKHKMKDRAENRIPEKLLELLEYNKTDDNSQKVRDYFAKCGELCWHMCIQDPPIYMILPGDGSSYKDLFRPYTRSGPALDFLVWPSLLLHEDGALLYKGVAQFKEEETFL